MNIFRGIFTTILIVIFALTALATVVGMSVERTVNAQTAAMLVEKAKAGERVVMVLPDLVKRSLSGPSSALRVEDVKSVVNESLSSGEAETMLKDFASGTVGYIRGDSVVVPKMELSPFMKRAETAIKKTFPGMVGTQIALAIDKQFATAGLDKGLEIPHDRLDAARNLFSQFRAALQVATAALFILFLLIFAVAPHGLGGRLRWGGAAFIAAGCLSAVVAACASAAAGVVTSSVVGGDAPPEIKDLFKDATGALIGMLSKDIFMIAASCIGIGAVLVALGFVLRKADTSSAPPKLAA